MIDPRLNISIIPPDPNWFESIALDQLGQVNALPGMISSVALPDCHPGKGSPNGAVFLSQGQIYPHLIGNDVGCGYGFWQTDLKLKKLKADRWADRISGLEFPSDDPKDELANTYDLEPTPHDQSLGTIGGGNHFAELQAIDSVLDAESFAELQLDSQRLFLLVHSGSRSLGESIYREHVAENRADGLEVGSQAAKFYRRTHDHAVRWAKANRRHIANRFAGQLNADLIPVFDLPHNFLEPRLEGESTCWVHRKGASPADRGVVVIPGSRGAHSFLVKPRVASEVSGFSLAHGAGRKWDRGSTEKRLRQRFRKEALSQTSLGGRVICEDKTLLFQEAPEAYKDIYKIMQHLEKAGLVDVIATLRPVITYKTRGKR